MRPVDCPSITPAQARAARQLLGWTLPQAAARISVSKSTVFEVEHGRFGDTTLPRLQAVYARAGVEFADGGARLVKTAVDGDSASA